MTGTATTLNGRISEEIMRCPFSSRVFSTKVENHENFRRVPRTTQRVQSVRPTIFNSNFKALSKQNSALSNNTVISYDIISARRHLKFPAIPTINNSQSTSSIPLTVTRKENRGTYSHNNGEFVSLNTKRISVFCFEESNSFSAVSSFGLLASRPFFAEASRPSDRPFLSHGSRTFRFFAPALLLLTAQAESAFRAMQSANSDIWFQATQPRPNIRLVGAVPSSKADIRSHSQALQLKQQSFLRLSRAVYPNKIGATRTFWTPSILPIKTAFRYPSAS